MRSASSSVVANAASAAIPSRHRTRSSGESTPTSTVRSSTTTSTRPAATATWCTLAAESVSTSRRVFTEWYQSGATNPSSGRRRVDRPLGGVGARARVGRRGDEAVGPRDPGQLAQRRDRVVDVVEAEGRPHAVDRAGAQRQAAGVGRHRRRTVGAAVGQHRPGEVAGDRSRAGGAQGGREHTGAGTDVQHRGPGAQRQVVDEDRSQPGVHERRTGGPGGRPRPVGGPHGGLGRCHARYRVASMTRSSHHASSSSRPSKALLHPCCRKQPMSPRPSCASHQPSVSTPWRPSARR